MQSSTTSAREFFEEICPQLVHQRLSASSLRCRSSVSLRYNILSRKIQKILDRLRRYSQLIRQSQRILCQDHNNATATRNLHIHTNMRNFLLNSYRRLLTQQRQISRHTNHQVNLNANSTTYLGDSDIDITETDSSDDSNYTDFDNDNNDDDDDENEDEDTGDEETDIETLGNYSNSRHQLQQVQMYGDQILICDHLVPELSDVE